MTEDADPQLVVSMQSIDHQAISHLAFGVLVGSRHAFFPLPEGATVGANNLTVLIAQLQNPSAVDIRRPQHIEIAAINGGSGHRTALLKLEPGGTHIGPPTPKGIEAEASSRLKDSGDVMATLASFGFKPLADEPALRQMIAAAFGSPGIDGVPQSRTGEAIPANQTIRDVGLQDPEQITGCYFSDVCGVNPDTHVPDPLDE